MSGFSLVTTRRTHFRIVSGKYIKPSRLRGVNQRRRTYDASNYCSPICWMRVSLVNDASRCQRARPTSVDRNLTLIGPVAAATPGHYGQRVIAAVTDEP